MPICKNNPKRSYTGKEPSPKGLGYCASGEVEGTLKKGRDGNMWIKSKGKWIKKMEEEDITAVFVKKLNKWWQELAEGNIIVIYKDGKDQLIKSSMKTFKAQVADITQKWKDFEEDKEVEAIIWSSQSIDSLQSFVERFVKKSKKEDLKKIKDLPSYILKNYKKYLVKSEIQGKKDYAVY